VHLKKIADIRTGLVLSRKKASLSSEIKISYPLLSLKDFGEDIIPAQNTAEMFVATEKIKEIYLTQPGDVIIRLRRPVRALYIDTNHAGRIVPSLMVLVRTRDADIDPRFLTYTIHSSTCQASLMREIKGTTIAAIKTRDLEHLDIPLPPMAIQQKVVTLMQTMRREQDLLEELIREKKQLSQSVLDTIMQQYKEEN